jgi:hypothetical protein
VHGVHRVLRSATCSNRALVSVAFLHIVRANVNLITINQLHDRDVTRRRGPQVTNGVPLCNDLGVSLTAFI